MYRIIQMALAKHRLSFKAGKKPDGLPTVAFRRNGGSF